MTNSYDMPDRAEAMTRFGVLYVIGVDHAGVVVSSYCDGFDNPPTAIAALTVRLVSSARPGECRVTVEYEWGVDEHAVTGETLAAHVLRGLPGVSTLHTWTPGEFTAFVDADSLSFLLGPGAPSDRFTGETLTAVTMGDPLR